MMGDNSDCLGRRSMQMKRPVPDMSANNFVYSCAGRRMSAVNFMSS